jgi:hypothetical protein
MILDPNKVYIIITYGQSNALGIADVEDASDPVLNPATVSPNYKVEWDWTNSVFTIGPNAQVVKSISDNSWNRISPSYYTVEGFTKLLVDGGQPVPTFVNIAGAVGGLMIQQLNKGTAPYQKLLDAITFTKNHFSTKTVEVLFMSFIQGESDTYRNDRAVPYYDRLVTFKNDFNTDAAAITGQVNRFPLTISQLSWGIPGQALISDIQIVKTAQAFVSDPELYFTCPTYQLPTALHDPSHNASDIHFSGYSLAYVGENMAKIYFEKAILGVKTSALNRFFYQRLSDNKVALNVDTTRPLMVDPGPITFLDQKGFEFYTSDGAFMTVKNVETIGSVILIEFTNPIPAGGLYYAYMEPFTNGTFTTKRQTGSIRDNDSRKSITNQPLYNWLPSFNLNIK